MPIKLKKTNIQYDLDPPEDGYVILGFDESGNLVTKNSNGDYEPVINDISTGNFVRLEVDYLTVGNRVSGVAEGLYSIGQGLNIQADGDTSYAQGNNAIASGVYTYAKGEFVEATGTLSHVSGRGSSSVAKLVSSGLNSFVHQVSTGSATGVIADYSAILGGINNDIGSGSNYSAIIGGNNNQMGSSKLNTVFLGCSSVHSSHTIESNAVYVPRLVLTNTSAISRKGGIYFDGTNFIGHDGSSAKRLDTDAVRTFTNGVNNRVLTATSSNGINGESNLTFDGSTLSTVTISATTGNITTVNTDDIDMTFSSTSSDPVLNIENTSTGDATIRIYSGAQSYSIGVDNSDSDKFKIYDGTSLSTVDSYTILETYRNGSYLNTVMNGITTFRNTTTAYPVLTIDMTSTGGDNDPSPFNIIRGWSLNTTSFLDYMRFYRSGGSVFDGGIVVNSGSPAFRTGTSDERLKNEIEMWDVDALNVLNSINVKTFYYNNDTEKNKKSVGWIAQDVQPHIPDMVINADLGSNDNPNDPYLTVIPSTLYPYFHKSIQQLSQKIVELEQRIEELENPS